MFGNWDPGMFCYSISSVCGNCQFACFCSCVPSLERVPLIHSPVVHAFLHEPISFNRSDDAVERRLLCLGIFHCYVRGGEYARVDASGRRN